jgi:hypothetical protein
VVNKFMDCGDLERGIDVSTHQTRRMFAPLTTPKPPLALKARKAISYPYIQ